METIAKDIFEGVTYPGKLFRAISEFIWNWERPSVKKNTEKKGENIWIARTAKVAESASITGPAIIGKEAEIRHCAFIRGNAIVGEASSRWKFNRTEKCDPV